MRARCFPLLKGISLPLPSSADSWGCSLNDGKSKLYSISPLATLKILKMQEVDGRRGLEMKTSAAAEIGNSPLQASLL